MPSRRCGRWAKAVMVASVLGLSGCAPKPVSAHVGPQTDFIHFTTFGWGPADTLPAGEPRLDASGFFQDHMQGAVERQMVLKGYEPAGANDAPDVRIHFHAVLRERLNVDIVDARRGLCAGYDCAAGVAEFEAGTLIVDVMDAHSDRIVWRGWAYDSVGHALDDQDKLAARMDQAVKSLMTALPGRR